MAEVRRIAPQEARRRTQEGKALLVCAYESAALCRNNNLEGSIGLRELEEKVASAGKGQEIVFYCA